MTQTVFGMKATSFDSLREFQPRRIQRKRKSVKVLTFHAGSIMDDKMWTSMFPRAVPRSRRGKLLALNLRIHQDANVENDANKVQASPGFLPFNLEVPECP